MWFFALQIENRMKFLLNFVHEFSSDKFPLEKFIKNIMVICPAVNYSCVSENVTEQIICKQDLPLAFYMPRKREKNRKKRKKERS